MFELIVTDLYREETVNSNLLISSTWTELAGFLLVDINCWLQLFDYVWLYTLFSHVRISKKNCADQ